MRPIARTALLVLLAILVGALAAGCAESSDADKGDANEPTKRVADDTRDEDDAGSEATATQAEGSLRIRLEQVGGKDLGIPVPAAVACDKKLPATCDDERVCPAEEGDDQGAAICAWLHADGIAALTAEVPEREACTMQYGGPTTATVSGTMDGVSIDAEFSRQDGCAIARFEAASPLWTGEVPSAVPPPADGGGAAAGACPVIEPDTPVSSNDAADAAADQVCPGAPPTAPGAMEPDVISDPPEAFE